MAVYTLIVGKDLNEDTLISQIFDNRTTIFFADFQHYISNECTNERSNALYDKHCSNCSITFEKCNKKGKHLKKWIEKKGKTNTPLRILPQNNENICPTCCNCLTLRRRKLKANTTTTYWDTSKRLLSAHPNHDEMTVEDLIIKHLSNFVTRNQVFWGSYRNSHDNSFNARENLIKPSLKRFIGWLRKRMNFDTKNEDKSNDEVTFCLRCKCGHKDCLQLGNFSCHRLTKCIFADGSVKEVSICKGEKHSYICRDCKQKYPICCYSRWWLVNQKSSQFEQKLRTRSFECNMCFCKNVYSGYQLSDMSEVLKRNKKAGAGEEETSQARFDLIRQHMTGDINSATFNILKNDLRVKEKEAALRRKKPQVKTTEVESFQEVLNQDMQCTSSFKEARDRLGVLRKQLEHVKRKVECINVSKKIKFIFNTFKEKRDALTEIDKEEIKRVVTKLLLHLYKNAKAENIVFNFKENAKYFVFIKRNRRAKRKNNEVDNNNDVVEQSFKKMQRTDDDLYDLDNIVWSEEDFYGDGKEFVT